MLPVVAEVFARFLLRKPRRSSMVTPETSGHSSVAWALYWFAFAAAAHTWTFTQDGAIETQNGSWSFKKGGRIDAEFQHLKGTNTVVLRRSDGVVCEVPLEVLSEKDQDFVLHPPEDTRLQGKTKVDEAAKIERYWRSHALNVIDDLEASSFPTSDTSQKACREIVACMRQLTNAVATKLEYTNFHDLLQKEALAVEKLKDTRGTTLPRPFAHHTEEFFRFMMNSRDEWSDELKGETRDYREYRAFLRERGWAQARVHFLYCAGIADKCSEVLPEIVEAEAAVIQSEQQMARSRQNGTPYPLLHGMSLTEIGDRLRAERASVLSSSN